MNRVFQQPPSARNPYDRSEHGVPFPAEIWNGIRLLNWLRMKKFNPNGEPPMSMARSLIETGVPNVCASRHESRAGYLEMLHVEQQRMPRRGVRRELRRASRLSLWVMNVVFWAWSLQSAVAMETRLVLGPSPEEIETRGLPHGWQPLRFHDIAAQTEYTVGMDGDRYAIKAVSESSASGIYTEVDLQPEIFQHIFWEWKVSNLIEKGDRTQKSGDDFPVRLIVAFHYQPEREPLFKRVKYELVRLIYGRYPPGSALVYVWDHQLPVGSTFDNAYTSWAKVVVLESGPSKVGKWVRERRNVYEDYRSAFGRNPPQMKFIGIMTDTDDTGEQAVAYYRQIVLERSPGEFQSVQREDQ